MGKDDYASSGGALKLKGAKDAGIDKKKKKKKDKKPREEENADQNESLEPTDEPQHHDYDQEGHLQSPPLVQKTEAERKHEEIRRKRLDERLKKEGNKTHKERVEALNKYLSTLSEHHDMPRIGPG